MEERYPYIRFLIDAAQAIAGAAALIVFLGGAVSACHRGGGGGFFSFLISIGLAGVVYVAVMARIESLRAMLDIESNTRQLLAASRPSPDPTAPRAGS